MPPSTCFARRSNFGQIIATRITILAMRSAAKACSMKPWPNFRKCWIWNPRSAEAHRSLGVVLFRSRRAADALAQFQQAVQLEPTNVDACGSLAWFLATCPDPAYRNPGKAVELAQTADRLSDGKTPALLATLAAAYSAAGRSADASQAAQRALDLTAQSNPAAVPALRQQLAPYLTASPQSSTIRTNGAN